MRIFVSEYLCGGGCAGDLVDSSLRQEGRAMLTGIAADFSRLPGCRVVTTWDARLGDAPPEGVDLFVVQNAEEETRLFRRLAAECDRTFVIAPELDGILTERRRTVESAGGHFLGASTAAIELCADKLRLANHFVRQGLPTIETAPLNGDATGQSLPFPAVIKRRDGAGSLSMLLVSSHEGFKRATASHAQNLDLEKMIVQPFVPGQNLSVGAIVSECGREIDLFPVVEQRLSRDGRFRFLGGSVPTACPVPAKIEWLVRRACRSIPGLTGYVGVDVLLPHAAPFEPLLVEINPRLTTSYLGYRALAVDNIAQRLIFPQRRSSPVRWKNQTVSFRATGDVSV